MAGPGGGGGTFLSRANGAPPPARGRAAHARCRLPPAQRGARGRAPARSASGKLPPPTLRTGVRGDSPPPPLLLSPLQTPPSPGRTPFTPSSYPPPTITAPEAKTPPSPKSA
ncbi:PREDICTED: WAS/WASL-interacting protein family member 2-like [Charadrius vociferus]|uniref:WAS/WASL-interacting protein family member 2-like n=1 Tax=Charadrius vociferus TaxID=50402 RepID=UPI000521781D|nr:PREDICTED: WAS/WASL-interacting protein family member 2-like [Charadrius vociferus]